MSQRDVAAKVRRLADEIRSVADGGLRYSGDLPYDSERYRHFRRIAAQLMALVDTRDVSAIESELFSTLTHIAPVPVASAAVFDAADRILLIQRADNGEWEMPVVAWNQASRRRRRRNARQRRKPAYSQPRRT